MEYTISKSGRKIYAQEFKSKILKELDEGKTHHEVSNKYSIPVRYLYDWKHSFNRQSRDQSPTSMSMVPISEYNKMLDKIKKLERALGQKTMDCHILQEAVDIASKKKWI
jgi:transposase